MTLAAVMLLPSNFSAIDIFARVCLVQKYNVTDSVNWLDFFVSMRAELILLS